MENVATLFKNLQNNHDFTDVTLVSNEGHKVDSHKIILTAFSPVFCNMLQTQQNVHPMIFLRGVNQEQLTSVLDFMYTGEAKINKSNLDEFLQLAKELQLKGLANNSVQPNPFFTPENKRATPETNKTSPDQNEMASESFSPLFEIENEITSPDWSNSLNKIISLQLIEENEPLKVKDKTISQNNVRGSYNKTLSDSLRCETQEEITAAIKSNIEYLEKDNIWRCKICGKTQIIRNKLEQHMETHVTGFSYPCNSCGKTFKSRPSYYNHKSKQHKLDDQDQICNICPFSSEDKINMKRHRKDHSEIKTMNADTNKTKY